MKPKAAAAALDEVTRSGSDPEGLFLGESIRRVEMY